ncbi:recombinase family protein [Gracilimonas sp. Q87]|uniref:recombinase family protein n=1 Tax=Gracilimonas sp. Q87 TaxID=3384766 RepID=UPI0039842F4A
MKNQPLAYSYIRFSKLRQKDGDSERRQTEDVNPEAIARELGLPLDNKLNLIDRGKSGFTGEHRTKGALGEFEKLIEEGEIAPGSVLIIEEMDRLTREALLESVHLMTGILLKGVGIYTGMDEQYYTKETFDFGQLVLSANKLQTGHEESLKKSKRGTSTWKEKRKQAEKGNKKLTAVSPMWLEPIWEDETKKENVIGFEPIPDIVEAVREIFRLKENGMGNAKIAKALNEDERFFSPEPNNRNKNGGWPGSTIQRYIHDRRVLGELQLYKKNKDTGGKRVVDGDPIKDYYPAIVDEDLFYAVQNRLQRFREKNGCPGGRTGKVKNLFSHITKCGQCGGSMHFIDKGKPPKGRTYLRCDVSRRALTDENGKAICTAKNIRYDDFFDIFFKYIDELEISSMLPNPENTHEQLEQNRRLIDAKHGRIRESKQQEKNLADSIANTKSSEARESLESRLSDLLDERKQLHTELEKLERQRMELSREAEDLRQSVDNIETVRELLDSQETEGEQIETRRRLRGLIRKLISRIDIYPLQEDYKEMEELEDEPGVYLYMESEYIEKIRVWFNTANNHKAVIQLKRHRVAY